MPPKDHCLKEYICKEYQSAIEQCCECKRISPTYHKRFEKYHFSTIQKIRATQYFRDQIKDIIEQPANDLQDLLFKVNLYFDGYLYNFQSSMDILGQEINVLYNLNIREKDVTLYVILEKLNSDYTSLDITKFLNRNITTSQRSWWGIVRRFRNAISHKQIIGIELIQPVEWDGHHVPHIMPYVPLLSNFNKKSETKLQIFCNLNIKRMCDCIEGVYELNINRLNNNERVPFI